MRSPADMQVIQIELTNACPYRCSNCTRFSAHIKKPFFMDWKTFQKAVLSLKGYHGMAGMMGGEPTLHPEFEKFAIFLANNFGEKTTLKHGRAPIPDFLDYVTRQFGYPKKDQRGLWTSAGALYYRHFEVIQEIFHTQLINDHQNNSLHQGILVSRKDLGIPDNEWFKMRDACWLQNTWSASITPKGAFFCEVAAALDMLFDGPGGWPIEPGWWKRKPADFGDQLNWCELCGIALQGPLTRAHEKSDDVSKSLLELLCKAGSPRIAKGEYRLFEPGKNFTAKPSRFVHYVPKDGKRVSTDKLNLYPKSIETLIYPDAKRRSTRSICDFGEKVSALISSSGKKTDWILVHTPDIVMNPVWRHNISQIIFNPGCLYLYNSFDVSSPWPAASLKIPGEGQNNALFFMFNPLARCIRGINWPDISSPSNLFEIWDKEKIIRMSDAHLIPPPEQDKAVCENPKDRLMCEHILTLWSALSAVCENIAFFGAGKHTRWLLEELERSGAKMPRVIYDENAPSGEIRGIKVMKPDKSVRIDAIVVSSDAFAAKMQVKAKKIWGKQVAIINPYSNFKNPVFRKISGTE